ncbi:haspin [Lycorma delicatula]|uniref:haspin n=1 Tax=Lycorma delicatula TaxID=130591 RepID=UPI003F515AE5
MVVLNMSVHRPIWPSFSVKKPKYYTLYHRINCSAERKFDELLNKDKKNKNNIFDISPEVSKEAEKNVFVGSNESSFIVCKDTKTNTSSFFERSNYRFYTSKKQKYARSKKSKRLSIGQWKTLAKKKIAAEKLQNADEYTGASSSSSYSPFFKALNDSKKNVNESSPSDFSSFDPPDVTLSKITIRRLKNSSSDFDTEENDCRNNLSVSPFKGWQTIFKKEDDTLQQLNSSDISSFLSNDTLFNTEGSQKYDQTLLGSTEVDCDSHLKKSQFLFSKVEDEKKEESVLQKDSSPSDINVLHLQHFSGITFRRPKLNHPSSDENIGLKVKSLDKDIDHDVEESLDEDVNKPANVKEESSVEVFNKIAVVEEESLDNVYNEIDISKICLNEHFENVNDVEEWSSLNVFSETDDVAGKSLTEDYNEIVNVKSFNQSVEDINFVLKTENENRISHSDAKERVFKICKQIYPLPFSAIYSVSLLKNCKKIGEGSFSEVFCITHQSKMVSSVVFKIIPIEGYYGESQLKFLEVLGELSISVCLSQLRDKKSNYFTDTFSNVTKVTVLQGRYPLVLVHRWHEYSEKIGTENRSPAGFGEDQLYVSLEMQNGGEPLEKYVFSNAAQSYHVLIQVVFALAVGEKAFQFEHRDLHWGNVLIKNTSSKDIKYKFEELKYSVPTKGKRVTIIDFTLSRKTDADGEVLFANLENDEDLFTQEGDLQFDVYRRMREDVRNNWRLYVPKTNLRWVHYLADKCCTQVQYKKKKTVEHLHFLKKIEYLKDTILQFNSAGEAINSLQEFKVLR